MQPFVGGQEQHVGEDGQHLRGGLAVVALFEPGQAQRGPAGAILSPAFLGLVRLARVVDMTSETTSSAIPTAVIAGSARPRGGDRSVTCRVGEVIA
ncbi:hypothetical protein ACWGH8_25020 [Nonomuraea muscovyensis]